MKKLLAVLLAAMMVFCLAACGDKDEEKSKKSDSESVSAEEKEDNDNVSAVEKSRIKTDEANARCLNSLLVCEYMNDPDAFNTSATYYLSNDGKTVQTTSSGAIEYTSDKYKAKGFISGGFNEEGSIVVNCEKIYEDKPPYTPDDEEDTDLNASEDERIQTDEANARCLKSLIVAAYLEADPGTFDTSATYYLSSYGSSIQTFTDGAIEYKSEKYKDNGYISGTCDENGLVTINCEGI